MSAGSTPDLPALVSVEWLANALGAPDLRVVDASWHLPTLGRDPRAEYASEHIPGATFFDLDGVVDPTSNLPHMLPDARTFAEAMASLGISDGDRVVAYDASGIFSAPRFWWMLRTFGHDRVAVLDGGFPAWRAAGQPTASGIERPPRGTFTPRFREAFVRAKEHVAALAGSDVTQLVDARSAGRFQGTAPEPRPGLRGGHIPGSLNVPFDTLLDPHTGQLLTRAAIRDTFAAAGVDLARPIVTTCGTGVTAAVLSFALAHVGAPDAPVYDGSWTQWAQDPELPVATGAAQARNRPGPGAF